jgi:hypothetical protein
LVLSSIKSQWLGHSPNLKFLKREFRNLCRGSWCKSEEKNLFFQIPKDHRNANFFVYHSQISRRMYHFLLMKFGIFRILFKWMFKNPRWFSLKFRSANSWCRFILKFCWFFYEFAVGNLSALKSYFETKLATCSSRYYANISFKLYFFWCLDAHQNF